MNLLNKELRIREGRYIHKVKVGFKIDEDRIWFENMAFNKSMNKVIKTFKGYQWHGHLDPPIKKWSIANCPRNVFQLRYLWGENVYAWWERPLLGLTEKDFNRPEYAEHGLKIEPQQIDMVNRAPTYHYQIWAAEQGCIDGDAVVHLNRASRGFSLNLRELCYKFNRAKSHNGKLGQKEWDSSITTYIRSFTGSKELGFNKIKDVLYKGKKEVLEIVVNSGHTIRCTYDHEICTGDSRFGYFTKAEDLEIGDHIMVQSNGTPTKIKQYPPNNITRYTTLGTGAYLDSDGYIRVGGMKGHPRAVEGRCFVYEHLLVMEEKIGRSVKRSEQVHHINGQRWDNRPSNLKLCENRRQHCREHRNLSQNCGNAIYIFDTITSIKPAGVTDVYDVVCEGPYHNFVADGVIVHNCGKTLAAIETMERSGLKEWWFVGPKSALASVELEFKKWGLDKSIKLTCMSYERLVKLVRYQLSDTILPEGAIFDECHNLKNPTCHRTNAAQAIADSVRERMGFDGYVIGLSGTPSAKEVIDLWSQCEIVWPGYLKEGSYFAFRNRYAVMGDKQDVDGVSFQKLLGWNKEEVAKLPMRYKRLMTVYRKKDWLSLPEKAFRRIRIEPSPKVLRVARSLCNVAPDAMTALTWTRALSSGFQYVNKCVGEEKCEVCGGTGEYAQGPLDICTGCQGSGIVKKFERQTKMVKCPKDDVLRQLLDETEAHGRIVIAASFRGSIDRILKICKQRGWAVACVDGRGWRSYDNQGGSLSIKTLDFWENHSGKVAFVANPGSARFGLTLVLADTLVFFDNNFSADHRLQMMDRIHRMGMGDSATIIDLIHLPIDEHILEVLDSNRELELLSLGAIQEAMGVDEEEYEEEILEAI